MKLTTTFNNLSLREADERLFSFVEQITGSRQTYGLDTPIDLYDLIDHLKLDVFCELLSYTLEDSLDFQKNVGVELIKSHLFLWTEILAGNPQLTRLIEYADAYVSTPVSEEEVRKDYCGDPIPGSSLANWAERLEGQIAKVRTLAEGLDSSQSYVIHHTYFMTNGAQWTTEMLDWYDWLGNGRWWTDRTAVNVVDSTDNTTNPGTLPEYDETLMIEDILEQDPDTFLKQSKEFDNVTVGNYTAYGTLLHRVVDLSGGTLPNQAVEAARNMGYAAATCAEMVLYDMPSLLAVARGILSARSCYASGKRFPLQEQLARLQDMMRSGTYCFPTNSGSKAIEDAENAVYAAGEKAKLDKLRDPEWIKSMDLDRDGKLSVSERANMEIELRKVCKTTRQQLASSLYEQVRASFLELENVDSQKPIVDIIKPYLL